MNNYKKTMKTIFAVISLTFFAKFLGFFRDALLGSKLGANMESDAYIMALNSTSIVFVSIGAAIVTATIPIVVRLFNKNTKKEAFSFVNNLLNSLICIAFFVTLLGELFSKQIMKVLAGGFDPYKFDLTVELTRIMFPILIFICITYVFVALLQSMEMFKVTSIISLPANIIMIIFLCFFSRKYGVKGLAFVTLIGWMLQFLVMTPFLYKEGYRYRLRVNFKDPYIKEFFSMILFIMIVSAVSQINILLDEKQASFLGHGKISFLYYANILYQAITTTTVLGINTVMFPKFAQKAVDLSEKQYAKFITAIMKLMIFVLLPMTAGIIMLREPIIGFVFERGQFNHEATIITGAVFACYALGMLSFGIQDVVNKAFYARNDKKIPVQYALLIITLNMVFNLLLGAKFGVLGLAIGTAVASTIGSIGLIRAFKIKMGYLESKKLWITFLKVIISCCAMAIVVMPTLKILNMHFYHKGLIGKMIILMVPSILGGTVYALVTMKLKLEEAFTIYDHFIKPITKKIKGNRRGKMIKKGCEGMKTNRILLGILIFAVLISSMTAMTRINIESNNKTVDVVLDYKEFKKMADQSNKDLAWWFKNLKTLGASSVGLNEESFESMMEENKPIKVEMIGNIIKDMNWENKYPKELVDYFNKEKIDEYDVLASTNSKELYTFIKNGLENRYDENKFKIIEGKETYLILLDGTVEDALYTQIEKIYDGKKKGFKEVSNLYSSKLIRLGLGLDEEKVNLIKSSGLNVVPRPSNYSSYSSKRLVEGTIDNYEKLNIHPSYMIFGGGEVLGYPDNVNPLASYMKKNNIKVGMIESNVQREHIKQKGLYDLTRNLEYSSVRIFSVWEYIQERFQYYNYQGAEEIENTLNRAVTERNIRVIYFKPFKYDGHSYVTDYKEYEKMFDRFKSRLKSHDIKVGPASIMKANHVRNRYKIMISWGVVAGGLLLLNHIIKLKEKIKYILLGIGIIGVTGIFVVKPALGEILLAMSAAIIFPSLSMAYFCNRCSLYYQEKIHKESIVKIIGLSIKTLVICSLISFIGSLMVGSILSDIEYLLEMSIFRGVKFSQLIPIVMFMILYMGYFGYKRDKGIKEEKTLKWKDLRNLLFDDVKIVYVILGMIVLVVGYIYMARTGHETNVQPSNLEMIFRNILEEKFYARPRTKEFLFAFPALMIGVFAAKHRLKWLVFGFGLAAVIGQTSIVNTFCHLRTPMLLSIVRTGYSLTFGIVLGTICVCVLYSIVMFFSKMRGEKLDG
ncbi:murein biosynthesis integral membrane protein MurJ [Crassaminicella profunda]|uniref:murein biosynthesis integral membrane protein MurJ n=1 Tax=Crassaminicella profunda TaxID=1286698 RepID=UPI001CA6D3E6|nr:murein biosynthesis integral membrane protein MurJ [Crassaminicella profunda]QZY55776.1 murein biosynthesis integral membrane protein MurJ [Crassaminicella profunda]